MADVFFTDFKLNLPGIAEICKSQGMQEELKNCADKLCASANNRAQGHKSSIGISEFKIQPYGSGVDVLTHTAVGEIHTQTILGKIDHAQFQTLNAINH